MKNSDYWKRRMKALEDERHQKSSAYYEDLKEQFRVAEKKIQADIEKWYRRLAENNNISYAQARKFLKGPELAEFKWTIKQYIEAGEENALDQRWMKELENASSRYHISYLEAMKLQIQQHVEMLTKEYDVGVADSLSGIYRDTYYHTSFEVMKGLGVHLNFSKMDWNKISMLIRKPWAQDGSNFSDRIWTNKQKLVNNLHTELTQNIIRGETPRKAINNIARVMEASRSQAGALIMTESAAIASAAEKDSYKELGVEQYEILATLDSRTSKTCQEMDGRVFDMKDYEVGLTAPPFHPRCRSTTVPYFDEFTAVEKRAARDPESGTYLTVPGDMTYSQWHEKYIQNDPEKTLAEKREQNLLIDKKQYHRYKELLGEEYVPVTLLDFQNMKYSDQNEYRIIKAQAKGMTYYNRAVSNEPHITEDLKETAKESGMKMAGLKYRIKGKGSYLRKIRSKYTPSKNKYEVKDIIRYTYTAAPENLVDRTLDAIARNEKLGYNTIEIKNSWLDDTNPYNGINTTMKAPNGQVFELQYHTPESFALKNGKMHELYEKQRLLIDIYSQEYMDLNDQMFELSDKLMRPEGIERIR